MAVRSRKATLEMVRTSGSKDERFLVVAPNYRTQIARTNIVHSKLDRCEHVVSSSCNSWFSAETAGPTALRASGYGAAGD
jgi:hypothetical protein